DPRRAGSDRRARAEAERPPTYKDVRPTAVNAIVVSHRRRSELSAASGTSQPTYQGSSDPVVISSATVAQPAPVIQSSSPIHTRRRSHRKLTTNPEASTSSAAMPSSPSPSAAEIDPGMLSRPSWF